MNQTSQKLVHLLYGQLGRLVSVAAFACFGLVMSAQAQFASSSVLGGGGASAQLLSQYAGSVTLCDNSALPPADPRGPWTFRYCASSGSVAFECRISAKSYLTVAIDPQALRARVLRFAMTLASGGALSANGLTAQCRG